MSIVKLKSCTYVISNNQYKIFITFTSKYKKITFKTKLKK